ncbi:MAG: hypothetical protein Q9220_003353 [cf. Caloplaca sp. 1 TL-2023]
MAQQPRRSSDPQVPFDQLLRNNRLGIIENPLRRIPDDRFNECIESFYEEAKLAGLIDLPTFIKAARLAKEKEAFLAEEKAQGTFSNVDDSALEKEESTKIWTETKGSKDGVGDITRSLARYSQSVGLNGHELIWLGRILTSWQIGTALGLAISGAVALIKPNSWTFQISSSFIPALILLLLVFTGSESPRWLVKKQRHRETYKVLLRLRENSLLAARDLVFIWSQLQVETILFMRIKSDVINLENRIPYLEPRLYRRQIGFFGYGRRITQLFTVPRARRATVASFLVMCAQQMTGINVFAFLASTILEYKDDNPPDISHKDPPGMPNKDTLWLFFGFGIANFVSSIIAYFYIDSKGRRWLLMLSLAAISEVFPQILREVGMAWASGICWLGAGILDLCVPTLISKMGGQTGLLGLFAALDVAAFIMVWLFVPGMERQIATMEEMNYVFAVPTRQHVRYQIKEVAPWAFDRYIRGRRNATCDPLYRYARDLERLNKETEDDTDHEEKAGTINEVV